MLVFRKILRMHLINDFINNSFLQLIRKAAGLFKYVRPILPPDIKKLKKLDLNFFVTLRSAEEVKHRL